MRGAGSGTRRSVILRYSEGSLALECVRSLGVPQDDMRGLDQRATSHGVSSRGTPRDLGVEWRTLTARFLGVPRNDTTHDARAKGADLDQLLLKYRRPVAVQPGEEHAVRAL